MVVCGCQAEREPVHPESASTADSSRPAAATDNGASTVGENALPKPVAANKSAPDYLPLAESSRWEYDVALELPLAGSRKASATTSVEGSRTIGEKTYFKAVMQVAGAPYNPTTVAYWRTTAEGVFQIFDGEEDREEWLYLPAKPEVGQSWTGGAGGTEVEFKVLGFEDVESAEALYRDCLHLAVTLRSTLVTTEQEQWLAPGVGIVKQTDTSALFDSVSLLRRHEP